MQNNGPNQHTQQPIVTGTSVVAVKFNEGVVIAAVWQCARSGNRGVQPSGSLPGGCFDVHVWGPQASLGGTCPPTLRFGQDSLHQHGRNDV